jgi:ribulose-5-phosphate 4-epimerase/fuculose-1-phosphate aldolase
MIKAHGLEESAAREEIVRACRVLEAAGQADLVWGHVSIRDAGGRGLWLKGAGLGFDEVREDNCILLSWAGEVLSGPVERRHVEYPIHTKIMEARPDVGAVVHTHPLYAIAFAATGRPLRPLSHEGAQFVPPQLPRFDRTGELVDSDEVGLALASALAGSAAILMPRHGITTVGETIAEAVGAALHLERACQIELLAGPDAVGSSDEEALRKRTRARFRFRHAYEYMARIHGTDEHRANGARK